MSRITPKNLQYNDHLPPFLARLHSASNSSSRDGRHEFNIARPTKARNAEEEKEDEPVYFDEETGESLTKQEWEEREGLKRGDKVEDVDGKVIGDKGDDAREDGERGEKDTKDKERLAAIGGSKKRKAGKIIGDGDTDGGQRHRAVSPGKASSKPEGEKLERVRAGKKGKKIKLSFGDDEA